MATASLLILLSLAEKKIGVIGGPQVGKSCVISTILKQCGRTKAKKATETKLSETLKLVTVPGNHTSKIVHHEPLKTLIFFTSLIYRCQI